MLRCWMPVFCLVFFGSACAGDVTDYKRFQGSWGIASLMEPKIETKLGKKEVVGQSVVPESETSKMEVVVDRSRFVVREKTGKILVEYEMKLDPNKSPKEIDLSPIVDGKTQPAELGIYDLKEDTLKVVLDENRAGRPKTFDGKTFSILSLQRSPKK